MDYHDAFEACEDEKVRIAARRESNVNGFCMFAFSFVIAWIVVATILY